MIDTNQIAQAGQMVAAVKAQVDYNWPAIAFAAALAAREMGKLNAWAFGVAEFVIRHGGVVLLIKKLIYNPVVVAAAVAAQEATASLPGPGQRST